MLKLAPMCIVNLVRPNSLNAAVPTFHIDLSANCALATRVQEYPGLPNEIACACRKSKAGVLVM
jgi:hypothetical protein